MGTLRVAGYNIPLSFVNDISLHSMELCGVDVFADSTAVEVWAGNDTGRCEFQGWHLFLGNY